MGLKKKTNLMKIMDKRSSRGRQPYLIKITNSTLMISNMGKNSITRIMVEVNKTTGIQIVTRIIRMTGIQMTINTEKSVNKI